MLASGVDAGRGDDVPACVTASHTEAMATAVAVPSLATRGERSIVGMAQEAEPA
jgi:hypothetical protein